VSQPLQSAKPPHEAADRGGAERFLVQCAQWRAFKVGVDVVRELYGVMAAKGAAGGFVVTSGKFTDDAIAPLMLKANGQADSKARCERRRGILGLYRVPRVPGDAAHRLT
jgi:Restriction endonuclease